MRQEQQQRHLCDLLFFSSSVFYGRRRGGDRGGGLIALLSVSMHRHRVVYRKANFYLYTRQWQWDKQARSLARSCAYITSIRWHTRRIREDDDDEDPAAKVFNKIIKKKKKKKKRIIINLTMTTVCVLCIDPHLSFSSSRLGVGGWWGSAAKTRATAQGQNTAWRRRPRRWE